MFSIKQRIIEYTLSLGFDSVGIPLLKPSTWLQYAEWIQNGYHGEMAFLANRLEERRDPSLLLPGVQSIILVAKNYYIPEPEILPDRPAGKIARFARGTDYHDGLKIPLQKITKFITEQTQGEHQCRIFVDSSPVMETDLAAQTQIGWKGKNTVLVNKQQGQYFLLGGILTTLPLEADKPHPNLCGTCQQCLSACPVKAFTAPHILDARRCISYLTIEYKGIIPEELRPLIGNRIFGCDACIETCPWNRFAKKDNSIFFHPRKQWNTPDLIEWMGIDNDTFSKLFKGTPVYRIKRKRLLRNIAIALGNSHDQRAIPVLRNAVQEKEPLIQIHADWAIQQIENGAPPITG